MIDELKPYPDIKPTTSRWLKDVPLHWGVQSLRTLIKPRAERNRPDLPLLSVARERGVFVRSLTDLNENHNVIPDDLSNYKVARKGNLVINKMKAWQGSMGIAPCDGIVSPAYFVFDLSISNPLFAQAMFRSKPYVAHFGQASDGVRVGQWDLSIPGMREIPVLLPPADEQAAIVRFLDYANGRIERAIRAKRKLIALLNEQKQAIIHRGVTRGLDPAVKLKPSGIPWLGDVPEHWKIKRIKYLMQTVDLRSATGDEVLLSMRKYHGLVPYHEHFHKPPQAATLKGFKLVKPGQIVVNRMQAGFGLIFSSTYDGLVSPDFGVFHPKGEVVPEFLGELFRSRDIRAQFQRESKGLGTGQSGFMRLYDDRIGIVHIAFPPSVDEQQKILSQLREDVRGVENTIRMTEQEIALLLEYRTTLTAEVVTGKLDVRDAAKRLSADAAEPLPADDLVGDEIDDEVPEEVEA